jgi:hypothetical protein
VRPEHERERRREHDEAGQQETPVAAPRQPCHGDEREAEQEGVRQRQRAQRRQLEPLEQPARGPARERVAPEVVAVEAAVVAELVVRQVARLVDREALGLQRGAQAFHVVGPQVRRPVARERLQHQQVLAGVAVRLRWKGERERREQQRHDRHESSPEPACHARVS